LTLSGAEPEPAPNVPDTYTLNYPAADGWCPPVRSTFAEAVATMSQVGTKRFRHQPNGGYGLQIKEKVGDKHLVHLGADLGWFQVGEPVFAVANGVVRQSNGPDWPAKVEKTKPTNPKSLLWGNLVVIEHRYSDASGEPQYLTTVYGHLDTDRRVKTGDIVQAGQQIGTIGRKHANINGGYDPHLHFGVRDGRLAEVGAVLMQVRVDGRPLPMRIVSLEKERVRLKTPQAATRNMQLKLRGEEFTLEAQGEGYTAPSRILWFASFPEFAIIGYDLSTDGWRDPIQMLRSFRADTNPVPYQQRRRNNR
jgi:murein DD-endopeptidase MepM/ murein hydrolase activator NlpD